MPLTSGSALLQRTAVQSFWNSFHSINDPFDGVVYTRPSTQATDTYARLGAAPMPQEWSGSKQAKVVPEYSHTLANKAWEASVKVSKQLIKYQQWDEIASLLANLGEKARAHAVSKHSDDINNNTAGAAYDTQDFFDTDHADVGAVYTTSQDNDLTIAITDADVPTDLEFAAALRRMVNSVFGFKDDQGHPFQFPEDNPSNFVVMVPTLYRAVAMRVMNADSLTGPLGNDLKGRFTVRVNQFLTAPSTTGKFYLFYTGGSHKALVKQEVSGIELDDTMQGDENFSTGDVSYSATWWGQTGYGQWRNAILYTFTQ